MSQCFEVHIMTIRARRGQYMRGAVRWYIRAGLVNFESPANVINSKRNTQYFNLQSYICLYYLFLGVISSQVYGE